VRLLRVSIVVYLEESVEHGPFLQRSLERSCDGRLKIQGKAMALQKYNENKLNNPQEARAARTPSPGSMRFDTHCALL
jgi:hypothetical protein